MYTINGLQAAKNVLANLEDARDNTARNNRASYQPQLDIARRTVHQIIDELWQLRDPELPIHDLLNSMIDKHYPDAKNREIVSLAGVIYQRRFHPVTKTRDGQTVQGWQHQPKAKTLAQDIRMVSKIRAGMGNCWH